MRGILFTEYFEFAATLVSDEDLETILDELGDAVSGAYTTVGNYSFDEFAIIHTRLAAQLKLRPEELARQFGYALLFRFKELFPDYFKGVPSGIEFLTKVGSHIHEEVKKLYPDARPPEVYLEMDDLAPKTLVYRSHRPLAPVAQGLASACLQEFGDPYRLGTPVTDGDTTRFPLEHI